MFALHTNQDVLWQRRACKSKDTPLPPILGSFQHKETGAHFEWAERRWPSDWAADLPHIIYVGPNAEPRLAHVHKTVAYVAVDEDAEGNPVLERWPLKRVRHYDQNYLNIDG